MDRTPTTDELDRGAQIRRLCAAIQAQRPSARCLAYLRVRSCGRTRELILGGQSLVAGELALLDWERAPLAEVFISHTVGDEYEIELDERRTLEGAVLDRAILRWPGADALEIDDGERCLRFADGEWSAGPGRWGSPLSLREPSSRATPSSPIEVALDEAQLRGVDLDGDRSLLILGAAGFGKTTVALHRVARLRERARLAQRPFSALVLVPTRGLQRLVTALLERLGASGVEVRSFSSWIAEQGRLAFPDLPARDSVSAPLAVSRVKRHPALREVLPEIVRGTAAMREVEAGYRDAEARTGDQLLHLFGDRALLDRVAAAASGALSSAMLDRVEAHTKVLFSPTTEQAFAHVDSERLRAVDDQRIDLATPNEDAGAIDAEDFAVLFELEHLRSGASKQARYDHVVVDEAQEFAAIELAVIGRSRAPGGSITVTGDENQQIDETITFASWPEVVAELGIAGAHETLELQISYRCPAAVEAFARAVIEGRRPAPTDDPALLVRAANHELELVTQLIAALLELRGHDRRASVAVVCRHAASARRMHGLLTKALSCRLVVDGDFRFGPGICVTCVDEVKGLEFDYVIIPDASAANYAASDEGRRALYVAATRAIARLWITWSGRGSELLD